MKAGSIAASQPAHDLGSGKFGAVVRPNERGLAVRPHQLRLRQDDVLRPAECADLDRQALAGVFIDHAKHRQRPPIHQLVVHKVVATYRIRPCCTGQANVVGITTPTRTPPRNVEPRVSPHSPHARFAQRQPSRHLPVAEARHFLRGHHQPLTQAPIHLWLLERTRAVCCQLACTRKGYEDHVWIIRNGGHRRGEQPC